MGAVVGAVNWHDLNMKRTRDWLAGLCHPLDVSWSPVTCQLLVLQLTLTWGGFPVCSLPLAHVTLRLESAAAGLWPKPADSVGDPSRVVRCLRAVLAPSAGDNASSVVASVYEQLLARRGALLDGGVAGADIVLGSAGDGAARSALRLGLLKSLVAHCRIVLQEELSSSLTGQVSEAW